MNISNTHAQLRFLFYTFEVNSKMYVQETTTFFSRQIIRIPTQAIPQSHTVTKNLPFEQVFNVQGIWLGLTKAEVNWMKALGRVR